jgi:DNA-binding MarR family transcriptional regulator
MSVDMHEADTREMIDADRIGQLLMRLLRVTARHRHQGGDVVAVGHVLAELLERGPQRVGELAQAMGTDPSTVSRQVTTLVEAGLVERRADPGDGRAHLLAATASGSDRCAAGRRRRVALVAQVLAHWTAQDRQQLADLLERLADGLQRDTMPARAMAVGDARTGRRPGGEN